MATNQLLVASSFDEAWVGGVGAAFEHYAQWKRVVGPDGTGSDILPNGYKAQVVMAFTSG